MRADDVCASACEMESESLVGTIEGTAYEVTVRTERCRVCGRARTTVEAPAISPVRSMLEFPHLSAPLRIVAADGSSYDLVGSAEVPMTLVPVGDDDDGRRR